MKRISFGLWLLVAILLSPSHVAHAYVDPGTGSMIVQATIGVIFGATYAFRSAIGRVFGIFKRKPKTESPKASIEE